MTLARATRTILSGALAVAALILTAAPAFATCTSPSGNAGDINYGTNNIMAYCNGTSWIGMGQASTVNYGTMTTGDFCTATSGTTISCNTATINLNTQASGTLQAAQFPALTGDVTTTAGSLATTVASIGGKAVSLGSSFTTSGAFPLTLTLTGATSLTLPTSGTLVTTTVTSLPSLAGVGTITTGTWQGTPIAPAYGGLGGNFSAASGVLIDNAGTIGAGIVPIAYGGTGVSSITAHGVVVGEGTSSVITPIGAAGTVFVGNGPGADPGFSATPTLTSLTLSGIETVGFGTDYTTTGAQPDVAINASSAVRYNGTAAATFYGIAAGANGQLLNLHNASNFSLTLSNQSLSDTTAASRIITGTGSDLVMTANSSVILQYDGTAARWRVIGGSGGGIPAGSAGQVQFNSGSNSFAADANLTWDNINKRIGIGTSAPAYAVDANAGTVAATYVHVNYASTPITGGAATGGLTFGTATPGQVAYYSGSASIAGTPSVSIGTALVSMTTNLDLTSSAVVMEIANGGTATLLNKLAKLGSTGQAAPLGTSDTSGALGIVVGGAGTTGNAQIAFVGQVPCAFDGATTAGHYVGISTTTAADCTDSGAAAGSGQTIGRVLTTNASAGIYSVLLSTGGGGSGSAAGPTAFSFTNQNGVALGSTISSNFITLVGFTGTLSASCTGCTSIGRNGSWGNTAPFSAGDTIGLQLASSNTASTSVSATVTLGGTTSNPWTVTTGSGTPNVFSFTNQSGVSISSVITSNAVTLVGSFTGATATCGAGCTDIIHNGTDCGATTCGGFNTGDTIAITQNSSSSGATATTATVTVGTTTSGTWQVTTGASCSKVVTTALSESSPYSGAINISYIMIGGGGGGGANSGTYGGGGGGGSTAITIGSSLVSYASGGSGGLAGNGSNGVLVNGSFSLPSGSTLAAFVGGGGGGAGINAAGGGGASGYYGGGGGGGGGSAATSAAGGGTSAGGAGGSGGQSGSSQTGGQGAGTNSVNGRGGSAASGGSGAYAGGGGGYGGGGGAGSTANSGATGGTNGSNGGTGTGGSAGTGSNTWSSATSIPAAAGNGGASQSTTGSGGNAGLLILNYTSPTGACSL